MAYLTPRVILRLSCLVSVSINPSLRSLLFQAARLPLTGFSLTPESSGIHVKDSTEDYMRQKITWKLCEIRLATFKIIVEVDDHGDHPLTTPSEKGVLVGPSRTAIEVQMWPAS